MSIDTAKAARVMAVLCGWATWSCLIGGAASAKEWPKLFHFETPSEKLIDSGIVLLATMLVLLLIGFYNIRKTNSSNQTSNPETISANNNQENTLCQK